VNKLVIDRAKWSCGGKHPDGGRLLHESEDGNGQMCCLGFLGRSLGADKDYIVEIELPSKIKGSCPWPKELFYQNDPILANVCYSYIYDGNKTVLNSYDMWEDFFASINDLETIDHPTREAWIYEGFKQIFGIEMEFIGEH